MVRSSYLYQWHSFNTSSQQNILTLPEELYEGLKAELSTCKWFQVKCLFHFTVTSWEDERSPSSQR